MPVVRKLVAQSDNQDVQWLKIDNNSRYIENHSADFQFLFGPNSALNTSDQILKISARFDDSTFTNLKVIGYLYDPQNNSVANAATCEFKFYRITTPDWTEQLVLTASGTQLSNNYFYLNPTTSSLSPIDFFGGDSLMVQATVNRSGTIYRDRIYVNHLGIYDNVTRLRQDVDFLNITKADI